MPKTPQIDPLQLARELVRCPSVTPEDAGALDVVEAALTKLGFGCERLTFSEEGAAAVDNLFARLGSRAPNFCFAGHTDVVPVGEAGAWSVDPFAAEVVRGVLYGRGATDMKGAIACFVAAISRFLEARGGQIPGSISLLITGDEEGQAINGTAKVLRWMRAQGEVIDACLVGEPTCPSRLGETIKIGRRGSLTGQLTVHGSQGHAAYPHLADNPIPRLLKMLGAISEPALDEGSEQFEPSNLEITSVDVGNPAANVIPANARASFNIRFNDRHSSASLDSWLRRRLDETGGAYDLEMWVSGEAYLTPPGGLSDLLVRAVEQTLGVEPELSTSGGISDARFIKDTCPVAELGLVGKTMHKVDECVPVADLGTLTDIYLAVLDLYFAA